MLLRTRVSLILLGTAVFSPGCTQGSGQPSTRRQLARPADGAPSPAAAISAPLRPETEQTSNLSVVAPLPQTVAASADSPKLEDTEERRGPFSIARQTFTAVLHYKHLLGETGPDTRALASLEILNTAGEVQYRESFLYTAEAKEFSESCSADIRPLAGSNGDGLLLDLPCLPSDPLSGGPWEIFGVLNGKLVPIGKPLLTEGRLGNFVPGAITRIGSATQVLPDTLQVRVWTGYFFVTTLVRVYWLQRKLALAQHCFYQTGQGAAEGGCEMPVEHVERANSDQDLTFVRLFAESNELSGTPAHVVVKKDSHVEVIAAKVLITWGEEQNVIDLGVDDDVWVKVRIDGKEGWVHTTEDLNAIGLYQSG